MQKCILIFDDDLEILSVCEIILKRKNYKVETRTRSENIVSDVQEINPNLILMDLWIPEIGGEQAIILVKENPQFKDIPVILFSANSNIGEVCENVKADGYLRKPFDIAALLKIVEENVN